MHWIKSNVVGLLGLILVLGSSLGTLYIKSAVNTENNAKLSETVKSLTIAHAAQATFSQEQAVGLSEVQATVSTFYRSENRLIVALDKLDVVYSSMRVIGAVQDEKIRQLSIKIDKLDEIMRENK